MSYDLYDESYDLSPRSLGDWGTVGTLGALGVTVVIGVGILVIWGAWRLLNTDLGKTATRAAILRRVSR